MYQDLVVSFRNKPRDIHTVPIAPGVLPKWFYVFEKDGYIYVESGHAHFPQNRIKMPRRLNPDEYEVMLDIYHRRKRGEHVGAEATAATQNQIYWYGVFADMNL